MGIDAEDVAGVASGLEPKVYSTLEHVATGARRAIRGGTPHDAALASAGDDLSQRLGWGWSQTRTEWAGLLGRERSRRTPPTPADQARAQGFADAWAARARAAISEVRPDQAPQVIELSHTLATSVGRFSDALERDTLNNLTRFDAATRTHLRDSIGIRDLAALERRLQAAGPEGAKRWQKIVERYAESAARAHRTGDARTLATRIAHESLFDELEAQGATVDRRVWHTAGDELVRPAHASANGQVAEGDLGTFMVGGAVMRYPGDPRAPVGLVVRCRCTVSVTGTDANGRRLALETGRTSRGQVAPPSVKLPPTQPPLPLGKPKPKPPPPEPTLPLAPGPAWARRADAAGEKILSELHGLAAKAAKLPKYSSARQNLQAAMHKRLFRHTNTGAAAAIKLGKTAEASEVVRKGVRHFTQLVPTHLFRPGYRVRRAKGAPSRASATQRTDLGPGAADIHFRATTVPASDITHELGHTIEFQNRGLFEEAAAFATAQTTGSKKKLSDGATPGYKYRSNEYYRPGLSEKRESWRYATKIYPGWTSDPKIGDYHLAWSEVISIGLESLAHKPERIFVEVPAFADFMVRRVVLRPPD